MSSIIHATAPEGGRVPFPLYSAEGVAQWPRVSWIVEGVIQRQSLALVYGQSRIGKSFLVLDLAMKLASGEHWFGYRVEPSRVIYFAAEGPSGLPQRLEAHTIWNGHAAHPSLRFMRDQLDLCSVDDAGRLFDTVRGRADVLIVDTLSAASVAMDDAQSKEMGLVLGHLRPIVTELGCTVILVHHCGWADQDRPRGHSRLPAAADTRIHVAKTSAGRSWRVKGQREGADTEAHRYALRVIELPEGGGTSCAVEPLQADPAQKIHPTAASKHQRVVLSVAEDCLKGPDGTMLKADDIISRAAPIIEASDRHRKQRAAEAFSGLLKQGLLRVSDEGFVSIVR